MRVLPTQRSVRIDELAEWAKKNMSNEDLAYCIKYYSSTFRQRVFAIPGQSLIQQAIRRWKVTPATAESYAEAVFLKLKS